MKVLRGGDANTSEVGVEDRSFAKLISLQRAQPDIEGS